MDQNVLKTLVYRCMTGYYQEDVYPYFNDIETFLKFVIKNDGFHYIEEISYDKPNIVSDGAPFGFWNEMLKLKPKESLKIISKVYFYDIQNEGDEFFYVFYDYESLAGFFHKRDEDFVYRIIKNEPVPESLIEGLIDLDYVDIIDNLSFENKIILGDYILNKVGEEELFLDEFQTVVFQDISFKQNNQDSFILTEKNIMQVIEDPDSLKIIIEKYIPELIDKLNDIAIIATNNILYDDNFAFILDNLSEIFVGDIFEEGGMLNLKISNFRSLLSNPQLGNGSTDYTLEIRRSFPSYYRSKFGGLYIEDLPDFDFKILDELNDIFENHLN